MEEEEDLLAVLQSFETTLSFEELEEAAENLSTNLKNQTNQQQQQPEQQLYVEVVDTHRQLLAGVVQTPTSFVICEALLRLMQTPHYQHHITSSTQVLETLQACVDSCEKCLEVDASAAIPLLSLLATCLRAAKASNDELQISTLLVDLATQALRVFSGRFVGVSNYSKLYQCWLIVVSMFTCTNGGDEDDDVRFSILNELCTIGVTRFEVLVTDTKTVLPLYPVEKLHQQQIEVKIDFLPLTALSLVQSSPGESLARYFAEKLVQCYTAAQASSQVNNPGNKRDERSKAWASWIAMLTRDSIAVLRCPEFPGSELFLRQLANVFSTPTAPFVSDSVAIDTIASVLSALERDAQIKDEFLDPKPLDTLAVSVASCSPVLTLDEARKTGTVACVCREGWNSTFMIDCHRCHRWLHGACVGVSPHQRDLEHLVFTCSDCQVFALLDLSKGSEEELRGKLRQLIGRHLQSIAQRNNDTLYRLALRMYSEVEGDEEEITTANKEMMDNGEAVSAVSSKRIYHFQCCSREETSKLVRITANQTTQSSTTRESYLRTLLKTLKLSTLATMRCHVIKQISLVLEANPELFRAPLVKQVIEERLHDESILVRDACLDLVAKSVNFSDYRNVVLESVHDDGVSVRKRAIRLISDIILKETDVSPILVQFSFRIEDFKEEEVVKDTVKAALFKFFDQAAIGTINQALGKMSMACMSVAWLEPTLMDAKLGRKFHACCEEAMNQLRIETVEENKLACVKLCRIFARFMQVADLKDLVAFIAPRPRPLDTMAFEVCETFALCGARFSQQVGDEEILHRLRGNLKSLVMSCNPTTMSSVIKAIGSLLGSDKLMLELWQIFTQFLETTGQQQQRRVDHCERAILCLALLIKHGIFDRDQVAKTTELILPFMHRDQDVGLRRYALQAVSTLLVHSDSSQYQQIAGMIYSMLEQGTPVELKIQALATLHDILVESDQLADKTETEVALLTNIVIFQSDTYVRLLRDESENVRASLVRLLHGLLKRQVAHPIQFVAPLVSLLRDAKLHDLVWQCLREVYDRKKFAHGLVYRGIVESTSTIASAATEGEQFDCFSDCYYLFVSDDRKERIQFLNQLACAVLERMEMSHFLCQVMARLPYRSYQEVLCVIYVLRAKSALRAEEIRLKLDAVFRPVFKNEDACDQQPAGADVEAGCASAVTLAFALRLAQYLISKYEIKPKRLEEFSPKQMSFTAKDEKPLPNNLLARHQDQIPTSEVLPVSREFDFEREISGKSLRELSKVYAMLLGAMKGDTQHSYGASSSLPPPQISAKPAVSRKKRASNRHEEAEDEDEDAATTPAMLRTARAARSSSKKAKLAIATTAAAECGDV